jgi:hypothetical protein
VDLSGVWACSHVGTYYLQQAGDDVWWFGISRDDGVSFANVFKGTLGRGKLTGQGSLGHKLTGVAVDVPLGPDAPLNTATLSIDCGSEGSKSTVLTSDGPDWPQYRWEKIYDTAPGVAVADQGAENG